MLSKNAIAERRLDLFRLIANGTPLSTAITNTAAKYGAKETAIRRDWDRRDEWVKQVISVNDNTLVWELVFQLRQTGVLAFREYMQAYGEQDPDRKAAMLPARVGALRLVKDAQADLIAILQSIGIVEEKPQQIFGEFDVNNNNLPVAADPVMVRLSEMMLEKMEAEKMERAAIEKESKREKEIAEEKEKDKEKERAASDGFEGKANPAAPG